MNRRDLLKAAPAFALAGAVPAAAQADSPIMALLQRYMDLTNAAEVYPSLDDEELERLFYRERDKVEDAIMATPCVTAQDMAAKMVVAHARGQHSCLCYETDPAWIEARGLIGA